MFKTVSICKFLILFKSLNTIIPSLSLCEPFLNIQTIRYFVVGGGGEIQRLNVSPLFIFVHFIHPKASITKTNRIAPTKAPRIWPDLTITSSSLLHLITQFTSDGGWWAVVNIMKSWWLIYTFYKECWRICKSINIIHEFTRYQKLKINSFKLKNVVKRYVVGLFLLLYRIKPANSHWSRLKPIQD